MTIGSYELGADFAYILPDRDPEDCGWAGPRPPTMIRAPARGLIERFYFIQNNEKGPSVAITVGHTEQKRAAAV